MTTTLVAREVGLSVSRESRLIARHEAGAGSGRPIPDRTPRAILRTVDAAEQVTLGS